MSINLFNRNKIFLDTNDIDYDEIIEFPSERMWTFKNISSDGNIIEGQFSNSTFSHFVDVSPLRKIERSNQFVNNQIQNAPILNFDAQLMWIFRNNRLPVLKNKLREMFLYRNKHKNLISPGTVIEGHDSQGFKILGEAIADSRTLRSLNMFGNDLHPLFMKEFCKTLGQNKKLQYINMGSCRLNTFSLQYLFTQLGDHATIQTIDVFNNQSFTSDLIMDIRDFVFRGQNQVKNLKLSHCNINSVALSYLFRNLNQSKSLESIDVSMNKLNRDSLTSLQIGLQNFSLQIGTKFCQSKRTLEYLGLSDIGLTFKGLQTLNYVADRKLSLRSINLRHNQITQDCVPLLEQWIKGIDDLIRLDLQENQIEFFECEELLSRKFQYLQLRKNKISHFPYCVFFENVQILDLSNNNIREEGCIELSKLLSENPKWVVLNVSENKIESQGFIAIILALRENTNLESLIVAECQIDGQGIISYMANHASLTLKTLDISSNPIRSVVIYQFLTFISGGSLSQLKICELNDGKNLKNLNQNISHSIWSNQNFRSSLNKKSYLDTFTIVMNKSDHNIFETSQVNQNQLKPLFKIESSSLIDLNFSGSQSLFHSTLVSLSTFYNKIERLNLSNCKILNDHDLLNLSILIEKSFTLTDLNISSLGIGLQKRKGFKQFATSLSQNQSIQHLNLCRNQLSDYFHILCKLGLKSYRLTSLDLSSNLLGNENAEDLQLMILNLKNLRVLNLSHNKLASHSIQAITRATREVKLLKSLDLSCQRLLCADDLIGIANIIRQSDSLEYLNISNNPGLSSPGTILQNHHVDKGQQTIIFENLFFDKYNFASLINSIQKKIKYTQSIILDSCVMKQSQFQYLVQQLKQSKKLEYIRINHYASLDHEMVMISQLENIKILSLNYVFLTEEFMKSFKFHIQKQNCKVNLLNQLFQLKCIDFSYSYFTQVSLEQFSFGISGNFSVEKLFLNHCQLNNFDLEELVFAIEENENIQTLDLSYNGLRQQNLLCTRLNGERINLLENLILRGNSLILNQQIAKLFLQKQIFRQLNVFREGQTNIFTKISKQVKLQYVDLSWTFCGLGLFDSLNEMLSQENLVHGFKFLKSLNLSNNQMDDEYSASVQNFLTQTHLCELDLSNNEFTSTGMVRIIKGMMVNQTIQYLNVSNNKINNDFPIYLSYNTQQGQLENLHFLQISKNAFTKDGITALIQIMDQSKRLFIYNNWTELSDKDGMTIIDKYAMLGKIYKTSNIHFPKELKQLRITRSQITDNFCRYLVQNLQFLSFLQKIDLSNNYFITMYGRVYMLIHIFDPKYSYYDLKDFQIKHEDNLSQNLFNDGILRYTLMNTIQWLNVLPMKKRKITRKKSVMLRSLIHYYSLNLVQRFQDTPLAIRIGHKINGLEPPQFIIGSLLIDKLAVNYLKLKLAHVLTFILYLLQLQISGVLLMYFFNYCISSKIYKQNNESYWDDVNLNAEVCKMHLKLDLNCFHRVYYNYNLEDTRLVVQVYLLFNLLLVFIEVIIGVWLRRKINPVFQIISPRQIKKLKQPFPYAKEILKGLVSFILRLHILMNFLIFYQFYRLKDNTNDFVSDVQKQILLVGFLCGLSIFISLLFNVSNFINVSRSDPRIDQADYLTNSWKKFYFENFNVVSSILSQFTPVGGYQISLRHKLNYQILAQLLIILKSLPMLMLLIFFYVENDQQNDIGLYNFIFICLIIELFRIFHSCYLILTVIMPLFLFQYAKQKYFLFRFLQTSNHQIRSNQFCIFTQLKNQALTIRIALKNQKKFISSEQIYSNYNKPLDLQMGEEQKQWILKVDTKDSTERPTNICQTDRVETSRQFLIINVNEEEEKQKINQLNEQR